MKSRQIGMILLKNIASPKLRKHSIRTLKAFLFFFLLFFSGCQKKESSPFESVAVGAEERLWLEEFFDFFFLDSPAIYTLFGSKPMSSVSIDIMTEDDMLQELQKDFTQAERELLLRQMESYSSHDWLGSFERWMDWKSCLPNRNFLFRIDQTLDPYYLDAYIINVHRVSKLLQKHYRIFSEELGMDYNAMEVAKDFENPDSSFWKKALQNHLLLGLLYGFGEKNASLFSKELGGEHQSESYPSEEYLKRGLKLPGFRSYTKQDPIIRQYKIERKAIQRMLRKKNLVDRILLKLASAQDE